MVKYILSGKTNFIAFKFKPHNFIILFLKFHIRQVSVSRMKASHVISISQVNFQFHTLISHLKWSGFTCENFTCEINFTCGSSIPIHMWNHMRNFRKGVFWKRWVYTSFNARIVKAHSDSHSMSGGSIWASLEC